MDVMEAIRTRSSIRMFKTDPVSDSDLNVLLEAVQRCQSWANTQCWEVILVKDAGAKEKLKETMGKGNPAGKGWMDAPVIAVFCGKNNSSGYYKDQVTTNKGDWFMFDVGLAVENFCLVAHTLGLGTVTVGLFDADAAGKILGVPEGYSVVCMNPLGYPNQPFKSPKRKEIADFVHYDKF
jgi:nitroreductase